MLGFFLVLTSLLDILGLVPHSPGPTPAMAQRATRCVPLSIAGGLLLLRYRLIRSRRIRDGISCGLLLFVAWVLFISVDGVVGYLSGEKSWHIVPVSVFLSIVAIGNLWAFDRITGAEGL